MGFQVALAPGGGDTEGSCNGERFVRSSTAQQFFVALASLAGRKAVGRL